MFGSCFYAVLSIISSYYNRLDDEEMTGCFTFSVFLMYCDCKCFEALPQCAMGWSAVCDCRIPYFWEACMRGSRKFCQTYTTSTFFKLMRGEKI